MTRFAQRCAAIVLIGGLYLPATAKTHREKPLKVQIAKLLSNPAVAEAHWGIDVEAMDGSPIYLLNEAQLFQPASNAKLFTTAAAMALLKPETTYETRVVAKGVFDGAAKLTGDVVLVGGGDANLSGRMLPYAPPVEPSAAAIAEDPLRYLIAMADQVAATGLKVVNGDVVGDDTLFPWEPYAEDWAIDDSMWGYGAPVSALTINDNQIKITVSPGDAVGKPATLVIAPDVPYYTLDVSVTTGPAKSGSSVGLDRALGGKTLRIFGSIAVDAKPDVEEVAIQDPAEYAAVALKAMLEARGIEVTGKARAQHRILSDTEGFIARMDEPGQETAFVNGAGPQCLAPVPEPADTEGKILAAHTSPALVEDVTLTNKVSQNLHAELLLHHLGRICGQGSAVEGARMMRAFLLHAGIGANDFVFFDGSGLSGHDLVAPRATVKLLQYASTQPWFVDWKKSLPVGGEDGSLGDRFTKEPLKDHVFAKTGTLGEARALSGYLECASGKMVIFSIMVGNHLPGSHADRVVMDRIVAAIAATN